jgi:IS5 family transposase
LRAELSKESVPDGSTIFRFPHLLKQQQPTVAIFDAAKALLPKIGCR